MGAEPGQRRAWARSAALLGGALLAAASAAGEKARAAAWLGDEEIWTVAAGARGADEFGEAGVYLERALTQRWAWVAEPRIDVSSDFEPGWRGETQLSVKRSLYRDGAGGAAALQAGPIWTSEPSRFCEPLGGEVRALAGRSAGSAFVNVEAAYRAYGGGCAHGRVDATLGWRPAGAWMLLAQVFVDRDLTYGAVTKAQVSAVRFGPRGAGLQIGLRARFDKDSARETALVLGWWPRRGPL